MIERTRVLVIASGMHEMHKVEAFIEEISDEFNINHSYFGHILVAVTEAVKNAVVHGNQGDPGKKVRLLFEAREHELVFTVSDEGQGFDPELIPDPSDPGSNADAGRGIFLINRLADNVSWNESGNSISFEFSIASINFIKSSDRIRRLKDYYKSEEDLIRKEDYEHKGGG